MNRTVADRTKLSHAVRRGLDAETQLAAAQASTYGGAAALEMARRRHDERLAAIAAAVAEAAGARAHRRGPLSADELRRGFADCQREIQAVVERLRALDAAAAAPAGPLDPPR